MWIATALGPFSVALVPWTFTRPGEGARRYLTVVVRARFRLVPGAPMALEAADPIAPTEVLDARGVPHEPGDLAPFLPRGELWVRGRLATRSGGGALALRVLLSRHGAVVFQKSASVPLPHGGTAAYATPFEPVPRRHPGRAALLGGADPFTGLDRTEGVALATGTDLHCFHAVPPDQTLAALAGDENVVLDGFFADAPRFEGRLPGARGVARLEGLARGPTTLPLRLDSVGIDLGQRAARLLYRGNVELAPADRVPSLGVAAGLELGVPLPFPEKLAPPTTTGAPAVDLAHTAAVDISAILAGLGASAERTSALPFRSDAPPTLPAAPSELPRTVDWGGTLGPELQDVAGGVLPFAPPPAAGTSPGETLGFEGLDIRALLPATLPFQGGAPAAPLAAPAWPAAPLGETLGLERLSPAPAPPHPAASAAQAVLPDPGRRSPSAPSAADASATIGFEGLALADVLAGAPLPFAADAPVVVPEVPAAPQRDSSGGMTLGFDGVSIDELLRPAMPFTPPAHLGPRRVVLLPRSERPEKRLSVFFLDALRALAAS